MATMAFTADDFDLKPATSAPAQGGVAMPATSSKDPKMGTMAFESPVGKSAAPTVGQSAKKKHGRTLAFDSGDVKAAVEEAAAALKAQGPAQAPQKRSKELSSTVAFGAIPEEIRDADPNAPYVDPSSQRNQMNQTQAFGAVEENNLMQTVAYAGSVEEAKEALDRMEAQAAAPSTTAPSAGPRQGRKKPKWGATMAFGELTADALEPAIAAASQAAAEEAAPNTARQPGVASPQSVVATGSPMERRAASKKSLSSTMAFESPIEDAVEEARKRAEAQATPKVTTTDFSSTMAFAPEFEDPAPQKPRPAAGAPQQVPAAPTAAPQKAPAANLSSTLAFESPFGDDADDVDAMFGASPAGAAPAAAADPALANAADGLFQSAAAASKRAAFKKQKPTSKKRTMLGGLQQVAGTAEEAAAELDALRAERQAAGHVPPTAGPFSAPTAQAASPGPAAHQPIGALDATVASPGAPGEGHPGIAPPVVNIETAAPQSAVVPPQPPSGLPLRPSAPQGIHQPPTSAAPNPLAPNQAAPALVPTQPKKSPLMLIVAIASVLLGVAIVLAIWRLVL